MANKEIQKYVNDNLFGKKKGICICPDDDMFNFCNRQRFRIIDENGKEIGNPIWSTLRDDLQEILLHLVEKKEELFEVKKIDDKVISKFYVPESRKGNTIYIEKKYINDEQGKNNRVSLSSLSFAAFDMGKSIEEFDSPVDLVKHGPLSGLPTKQHALMFRFDGKGDGHRNISAGDLRKMFAKTDLSKEFSDYYIKLYERYFSDTSENKNNTQQQSQKRGNKNPKWVISGPHFHFYSDPFVKIYDEVQSTKGYKTSDYSSNAIDVYKLLLYIKDLAGLEDKKREAFPDFGMPYKKIAENPESYVTVISESLFKKLKNRDNNRITNHEKNSIINLFSDKFSGQDFKRGNGQLKFSGLTAVFIDLLVLIDFGKGFGNENDPELINSFLDLASKIGGGNQDPMAAENLLDKEMVQFRDPEVELR